MRRAASLRAREWVYLPTDLVMAEESRTWKSNSSMLLTFGEDNKMVPGQEKAPGKQIQAVISGEDRDRVPVQ